MARFDLHAWLLVGALVGCTSAAPSDSTDQPTPAGKAGATSEQRAQLRDPVFAGRLRELALGVSQRAGIASPKTMQVVAASDHQQAEDVISGAEINDHSPVYVVQMTGGPFTASHAPPGVEPPQGEVLTVTFDAGTMDVTDIGIDASPHDLAKIDTVAVDLMAADSEPPAE